MAYFYSIQFWIFLIIFIVSVICGLILLVDYLLHRERRRALDNHVDIIILVINLVYQFTDILFFIYYFRTFQRISSARSFRLFWAYMDWTFFALQVILFAWATVERHILIFHDQLVATKRRRLLFHYLPPVIIVCYCIIYYTLVIFASNCENVDPDDPAPSLYPCGFVQNSALYLYETIVNQISCLVLIVISSLALLLRVVWHKYRVHQQVRWRRHRRMAIQLLSITLLYLLFPVPYFFITFLYLCGMPTAIGADFMRYSAYFPLYNLILYPIILAASTPEFRQKFRKITGHIGCARPATNIETSVGQRRTGN